MYAPNIAGQKLKVPKNKPPPKVVPFEAEFVVIVDTHVTHVTDDGDDGFGDVTSSEGKTGDSGFGSIEEDEGDKKH